MRSQACAVYSAVRARGRGVSLPIYITTTGSGWRDVLSASGRCRAGSPPCLMPSGCGRRSLMTSCDVWWWGSYVSKAAWPRYNAEATSFCLTPRTFDASRRRRVDAHGTLSSYPATTMHAGYFCAARGTQTVSMRAVRTPTRLMSGQRGLPFRFFAVIRCGSWWPHVARPRRSGRGQ